MIAKKIRIIASAFLLSMAFGVMSCGTDPVAAVASVATKGTMTATVDGQAFSANLSQAQNTSGTLAISGNTVSSSGTTGNTKQITISGRIAATGTYQFGTASTIAGNPIIATYTDISGTATGTTGTATYGANSGTLVITELSATKVKGTFNFSGSSSAGKTISVTNGVFDINF